MKCTSAEAAKYLRKLNEDYASLLSREEVRRDFLVSLGEDPESVRPPYDFRETQDALDEMEQKIRRVKHAINLFNTTHTVPGFDLTIDEMLVLIPQLTKRKNKLAEMKEKLPKTREQTYSKNNIVDYRYINYDSDEAASEYEKAAEQLSRAQTALDTVNNTETLEIPGYKQKRFFRHKQQTVFYCCSCLRCAFLDISLCYPL